MKVEALLALPLLVAVLAPGLEPRGATPALATGMRLAQARVCVYDHETLKSEPQVCRPRARAYPGYVHSSVQKAIYDSALVFGVPYKILLTIARCESSLNPNASNGTHFGLFQFLPATFKRARRQLRLAVGLTAKSYWNPLDSSYAAGFLFVTGQATSWVCVEAVATPTG
jgi:hypothetical protein